MSLPPEELDRFAAGELDSVRAGQVREHLGRCAGCAREVELLRAEREAFRARHDEPIRVPGDFAAVMARVTTLRTAPARAPRLASLPVALAAAAALALAIIPSVRSGGQADAGALASGVCPGDVGLALCDDGSSGAIAELESRYSACLIATPGYRAL
jgi:anti-sigma factor RsiW